MRRARIKAVATVPVRRKAALEAVKVEAEKPEEDDKSKEAVKETDKVESKDKTSDVENEKNVKKAESPVRKPLSPTKSLPRYPVKHPPGSPNKNVSTSPVKQLHTSPVRQPPTSPVRGNKLDFNTVTSKKDCETENKINNNIYTPKTESLEKTLTPAIEASPVKAFQNRSCFMKPVPRLDGGNRIRRNSVQGSGASASESEDDSRRSAVLPSRVRNDSMCSVQSLKDGGNLHNTAKLNLGQKRRTVMSESARKLAEARREFLLKHENKSPDKSKLTMYDLIYYNPVTNPMKQKHPSNRSNARQISVCSTIEANKDENEEEAEEPAEMLVPQVKVGPNGQLIIDEQSLVIDQYKAQENIDRSDILVDEDTNGNGFYKRRQKSKDWNKWETIKFYKALNTYGTDFSLMREKFPHRSRIELKLKYKKEERINRALIEKALQYQEFDIEALEKDLASVEEKERKEQQLKEEKKNSRKRIAVVDPNTGKKKRKRCNIVAEEVNCENEVDKSKSRSSSEERSSEDNDDTIILLKKRPVRKRKIVKSDSSNENDNDISESESEVYEAKKTRSGRFSKKFCTTLEEPNSGATKEKKNTVTRTMNKKKQKVIEETDKNVNIDLIECNNTEDEIEHNNTAANIIITENIVCNIEEISNHEVVETGAIIIETLEDREEVINSIQNNTTIMLQIENDVSNQIADEINESNGIEENQIDETIDLQEQPEDQMNRTEDTETVEDSNNSNIHDITDDIPNISNLRPGSLVVLKKDNADDPEKTTLQVYIVSADYDASNPDPKNFLIPLDLDPDVLSSVTDCIKDIEPEVVT